MDSTVLKPIPLPPSLNKGLASKVILRNGVTKNLWVVPAAETIRYAQGDIYEVTFRTKPLTREGDMK